MSQQITRSTVANKSRLKVLAARQVLLEDIFEQARQKLAEGAGDADKYAAALKGLILEGLYALAEPEVEIRAREADYDLVRTAIDQAVEEYRENIGKETKATIDESEPVAEGSAGGVLIIGGNGKIEIDNTFEARLALLEESALPAVRKTLFGPNPNRRFFD